jgi:hypothetical protein
MNNMLRESPCLHFGSLPLRYASPLVRTLSRFEARRSASRCLARGGREILWRSVVAATPAGTARKPAKVSLSQKKNIEFLKRNAQHSKCRQRRNDQAPQLKMPNPIGICGGRDMFPLSLKLLRTSTVRSLRSGRVRICSHWWQENSVHIEGRGGRIIFTSESIYGLSSGHGIRKYA